MSSKYGSGGFGSRKIGFASGARYWLPALWPIALGLSWIVAGANVGGAALILAVVAGILPLAAGGSALIWGLDRMNIYHLALGGLIGALGGFVGFIFLPPGAAIALILAAIGVFMVAGWGGLALWQASDESELGPTLTLAPHAALDCALMGFYVHCSFMPDEGDVQAQARELEALDAAVAARPAADALPTSHAAPSPPTTVTIAPTRRAGVEWLTFPSAYEPGRDFPGVSRWRHYTANHTVGCRLLRHDDGPRPWLICVHGYRMGSSFDVAAFDAERLHREFGVNICMPILPLHGPRRVTRLTGGLFLDGPLTNVWHAVSQSLVDTRQCIAWLRATQQPRAIGVFGMSLGGYTAALMAAAEPELSPVIAAVPMVGIAPTLWQHMPAASRGRLRQAGIGAERLNSVLAPISPLACPPPAGDGQRAIVAAGADQVVPADQPRALWHHWGDPPIHWTRAGHLTIQRRADARAFVDRFVAAM